MDVFVKACACILMGVITLLGLGLLMALILEAFHMRWRW